MTKLAVIADIHYFSPRLGTCGRAYELRSGSDQKCLAESGAVTDSAFELIASSDADAVLIVGDITNDGEKCSHEEIREKLRRLNEKKPVYLITSTHDWCSDKNPRRFEGENVYRDVEAVSREELAGMYAEFGKETEIASFKTRAGFYSRVFQISKDLRLIAVNDDCDGKNGASGYSEEHMEWMIKQIRDAKNCGCDIIAMEHHLLLYGLGGLINKGQSVADNFSQASALADAGLRLMLVGHSHMQRTTEFTSPAGNKITQVNVGSLCGYPAPINYFETENGSAKLKVEFLGGFSYNGKRYGRDFFKDHTSAVFLNLLNAASTDKEDLRARLAADGIKIKQLDAVYPLVRFAAKKALTVTVGGAAGFINALTFGKGINKNAAKKIRNENLLKVILGVFLNVFDGSSSVGSQPSEVKTVVTDAASLPRRVLGKLPLEKEKKEKMYKLTNEIEAIAAELMFPAPPDNTECEISLC